MFPFLTRRSPSITFSKTQKNKIKAFPISSDRTSAEKSEDEHRMTTIQTKPLLIWCTSKTYAYIWFRFCYYDYRYYYFNIWRPRRTKKRIQGHACEECKRENTQIIRDIQNIFFVFFFWFLVTLLKCTQQRNRNEAERKKQGDSWLM